jgi:tetratricopeptide (TPR) repeat protein
LDNKKTLFLSYSWSDAIIADSIDDALLPTGVQVKRDIRGIKYKDSIKQYMSQIRDTDFVLLIISDSFIKSSNCMYEVLEILKDKDFKKKILPVVVDGTKIYKAKDQLGIIKYWSNQYEELKAELNSVNPTDAIEQYKELKHIENIRANVGEFLAYIADAMVDRLSTMQKDKFKVILDHIGVSNRYLINKILAIPKLTTEDEMEIALDELENEFPNNSNVYLAKGIHAHRAGKYTNSTYFYRKAIQLDPTFAKSYYNLAYNIEVYEKDFTEAKILYEKAIELNPTDTRAMNNLAGLYSKELGKPELARKLYEKSLAINPIDAEKQYNLATLLARHFPDEKNTAKKHYEYALEINPEFIDGWHNYAILLSEAYHDYDSAIQACLKILALEPERKNTLKLIGSIYEFNVKDINKAKLYYDRFITVVPNSAEQHNFYAMFLIGYFLPEFKQLAIEHYEKACEIDRKFESDAVDILLYEIK